MKQLRLGIIGMSPGNGHPYSWAAIFNGYKRECMKDCPFPVISEYLAQQQFPQDQIMEATVTHLWTQDRKISEHIAVATYIPHVVEKYETMIGKVDAILLARDDAQNHLELSKPFLQAGIPIYIDKPLAFDVATAKKMFALQKYPNQLFTASALAFAPELQLTENDRRRLGTIVSVHAVVIKDWLKYGVHIIEPVLGMINWQQPIQKVTVTESNSTKLVTIVWKDTVFTTFQTVGASTAKISFHVIGTEGEQTLIFQDTFTAFKNSLHYFVDCVQKKVEPPQQNFVLKVIEIIEKGRTHEKE